MQDRHLYEYAVIRVVPRVEREEFINVGLILFCKRTKFIRVRYVVDETKFRAFSTEIELDFILESLKSFEKICSGSSDGGSIAMLDVAERFRWLTAVRSTCIQTSRPHSGLSSDLEKTFDNLFQELVL